MRIGLVKVPVKAIVASLTITFTFLIGGAQPRPDLSGTWKMNPDQSKFAGPAGAPKELVIQLEMQGQTLRETLTVIRPGNKSTSSLNYLAGGTVSVNNVDGEQIRTAAYWSGETLVLEWRDQGGTFTRRFALSDRGRKMTVSIHDSNSDGESDDLVVLEKQ